MSDIEASGGEVLPVEQAQPEVEAQEAPAVEEQQAAQTTEEPRVVPLAALHEERGKRRELAAQIEAERRTRQELESRYEARLQAILQAQQKPPEPPPSLEENPVGHLSHKLDATQAELQKLMQQSQSEREQAQRAAMQAQLASRVTAAETAFVAKTPDYQDALKFMHGKRVQELQALGMDEFAAERRSAEELAEFAYVSAAQGRNPAETAYNVAKARGYQSKQQTPEQKMEAAKKGVAASQSLGGGGAAGDGRMTARQLLAMSDDEFSAATSGDKWKKLMGG